MEAVLQAASYWYAYRRRGRGRQRIAADFLVGGRALMQYDRLLTRDSACYRTHFTPLRVDSP